MANKKNQPPKKTAPEKPSREEFLYHNTLKLLQNYRDVVWSIEAAVIQARLNFELEFECTIEDFLELSYAAGADLTGTNVESQMRTIERNKKMLRILDNAIEIMRKKHKRGEAYYWILYYSFLSDHEPENVEEIINNLREHMKDMSWDTFYRKRKEAINCLSTLLWGYTSKECKDIVDIFLPGETT